MSDISEIQTSKPIQPAAPVRPVKESAAKTDFNIREGETYNAKIKGLHDGAALAAINDKILISLSGLSLKTGDNILLKFIKREADGKLIFEPAGEAGTEGLEALERSLADILKTAGADSKLPYTKNILESFLKFGFRLDGRAIEKAAGGLNAFIDGREAAGEGFSNEPEIIKSLRVDGRTNAAEKNFEKSQYSPERLFDAAALLGHSGIKINEESLKLAAMLLEKLKTGADLKILFSMNEMELSETLETVLRMFEGKHNNKAAQAAGRIISLLKTNQAGETGGLKIINALARFCAGDVKSIENGMAVLKDFMTIAGELEKTARLNSDKTLSQINFLPEAKLLETISTALENRAMLEFYSALTGTEFFKIPIKYEDEYNEAFCRASREEGKITSIDIYLNMSKLNDVRINVKKKETAAGIYIFVKNIKIKEFLKKKYSEYKPLIDSAMKSNYYFNIVIGRKIDFTLPFIKYDGESENAAASISRIDLNA